MDRPIPITKAGMLMHNVLSTVVITVLYFITRGWLLFIRSVVVVSFLSLDLDIGGQGRQHGDDLQMKQ